jgi:hypothetical protein
LDLKAALSVLIDRNLIEYSITITITITITMTKEETRTRTYFGSSGCSTTLRTKVLSNFRACPPSPAVRYLAMVAIDKSMRSSGLVVVATAAMETVDVVFFATGAGTGAAVTGGVEVLL